VIVALARVIRKPPRPLFGIDERAMLNDENSARFPRFGPAPAPQSVSGEETIPSDWNERALRSFAGIVRKGARHAEPQEPGRFVCQNP
jgi:hypothetical protein